MVCHSATAAVGSVGANVMAGRTGKVAICGQTGIAKETFPKSKFEGIGAWRRRDGRDRFLIIRKLGLRRSRMKLRPRDDYA
jgi:hypothetical protein